MENHLNEDVITTDDSKEEAEFGGPFPSWSAK